MLDFIRDGGPPSLLILIFGSVLLLFAAIFARRPEPSRLAFAKGLSIAMAWLMVGGVASCLRATLRACAQLPAADQPLLPQILMMGVAESLTVVIMGTAFLTLSWFIAAIGMRRLAPEPR